MNMLTVQIPVVLGWGGPWMDSVKDEMEAIAKKIHQEAGPFPNLSLEDTIDLVQEGLDTYQVKKDIAKLYVDFFRQRLKQGLGIKCTCDGYKDLEFLKLASEDFIHFITTPEIIQRIWEEADKSTLNDAVKEFVPLWGPKFYGGVHRSYEPSLSAWAMGGQTLEDWDEVQLGILLMAWMRTNGISSREVEKSIHAWMCDEKIIPVLVERNLDMDALKCKLFDLTQIEVDEDSIFKGGDGEQLDRNAHEMAHKCMLDPFWVRNAVERMQEPLIEDNDEIVNLVTESVKLYQSMSTDETDVLRFLCAVKPFWSVIKAHALKEVMREDVKADVFIR